VSRFPARDGKKHGAGAVHGAWQYEVFATGLDAVAWPAADAVTLYYGRCGQENAFGNSAAELRLGDVHSFTLHGQRMMTAIGMWCANLRRVMAAEHAGDLGEPLPQAVRPAEAQAADVAVQEPPAAQQPDAIDAPAVSLGAESQAPSGASQDAAAETPAATQASPAGPAAAQANEQAELKTETPHAMPVASATPAAPVQADTHAAPTMAALALSLICAAGMAIPLHNLRRLLHGDKPYAIYRGNSETCGVCRQRQACTRRTDAAYRREFGVPIAVELLGLRDEILRQARAGRKVLHAPGRGVTPQRSTAGQAPETPAIARSGSAPVPRAPTRTPRLMPLSPPAPGPWLPEHAQLYMPALVAAWQGHVGRMAIEVEVIRVPILSHDAPPRDAAGFFAPCM
jgi:hypothetical protein